MFLEEVRRVEDRLRAAFWDAGGSRVTSPGMVPAVATDGSQDIIARVASFKRIRQYLENHKAEVRAEAMATVQRQREHLAALRETNALG